MLPKRSNRLETWGWRVQFWEGLPCPAGPDSGLRAHGKGSGRSEKDSSFPALP